MKYIVNKNQPPEIAKIETYNWGCDYRPVSFGQFSIQGDNFVLHMESIETPTATHTEQQSMVCEDSCLECFINFAPHISEEYLNFECNANGSLHVTFGTTTFPRPTLPELQVAHPIPTAFVNADNWGFDLVISIADINKLYNTDLKFDTGYEFKGSFYKCGDLTPKPHWGSFNKIDTPNPSFHQPDFFVPFVIK